MSLRDALQVSIFSVVACTDADFLSNWMGTLSPAIGSLSLLDVVLPGSHDSMTADLSTTVSDGSNDMSPWEAWVSHEFAPSGVGRFIKTQAVTQTLNMTQQLENGLRFIDFRMMYTAAPNAGAYRPHDWYSLHMVETNQRSMVYLEEAKAFLDAHPSEVLTIWLSRHGSECAKGDEQYPKISPEVKQAFWSEIKTLFGPLLFDTSARRLNTTSISDMVQSGQRAVIYATDYVEFTASDPLAYDACTHLSNTLSGGDVTNITGALQTLTTELKGASAKRATLKSRDSMYLISLAGSPPGELIKLIAKIYFLLPVFRDRRVRECAAMFKIPGMTDWCPEALLDYGHLRNYYTQAVLDSTVSDDTLSLPGAIYIDAVGAGGTIATGAGAEADASFGYVDTLLYFNVKAGCQSAHHQSQSSCDSLLEEVKARRDVHPVKKWDDAAHGRVLNVPAQQVNAVVVVV